MPAGGQQGRGRQKEQRARGPARWFDSAGLWELRLAELQQLLEHRWFGILPEGQRDAWMLLAGVAIGYLVPAPMVRREITALADQVTGGRWHERETASRMSSVIARAELAARGERIDYRGHMVDPRYRFRTATIIEHLAITEAEMRACGFRHLVSPEIRREQHRLENRNSRRASGMIPQARNTRPIPQANSSLGEAEGISRATWYRRA